MENQKIRVLIADDISSLCSKYEKSLKQSSEIEVVGIANDGYQAIMKSAMTKPDVILMDIEMENKLAGINATREILKELPNIKIVILTVYEEDDLIYAAFQAGACDYVLKTVSDASLIQCVKDAYYGKSVLRPHVARKLRTEFKRIKDNEDSLLFTIYLVQLLTESEIEILSAMHEGQSQQEVCDNRVIEPATMKTHVRNITKKMKCKNIEDALKKIESSGFFYYMDKIKERKNKS